jgi:MFS family permease
LSDITPEGQEFVARPVGASDATIAEPARPGHSAQYLGGRPLRRYTLWFALATTGITAVWGAVGGVLLPNHIQALEFGRWFIGADASVDLLALQQLGDQVAAHAATATAEQQRLLGILTQFDAARAQSLAWITATGVAATLIVQPIVGVISDRTRSRFGRRAPWILFGALGGVMFLAGMRLAPTVAVLGLLWTLTCVILSSASAPSNATLADRVPKHKRGSVSSMVGLGTFAGGILGALGAGAAFAALGLNLYLVYALIAIIPIVLFVVLVKDRSSVELVVPPHSWGSFIRGFLVPFRARDFRWVWIARVLLFFGNTVSTALLFFMLQSYVRPALSATDATRLLPVVAVAGLPATLIAVVVAGRLSDRLGRRKPFVIVASFLMAVSLTLPLVVPTLPGLFAQSVLTGIAFGIYLPVDQALFVDVLPDPDSAGRDLGLATLALNGGQALGPVLAGQIVALTGNYGLVWPVAAGLVAVAGLAILPVRKAR